MAKKTQTAPTADAPAEADAPPEQDAASAAYETATEAYATLAETARELADQAQEIYDAGQATIRSHPGEFLVGAFALGVLTGILLDRL